MIFNFTEITEEELNVSGETPDTFIEDVAPVVLLSGMNTCWFETNAV